MTQNDFIPAPIGRRILAFVIDSSIVSAVLYALVLIVFLGIFAALGFPNEEELQWKIYGLGSAFLIPIILGAIFFVLTAAAVWHAYFIYFEHIYGKTLGKKALGMFVVSLDGKNLSFKQCVLREVFRAYVDVLLIFPGIISMLCSKKNQRVGDMATNTLVLYSPNLIKDEAYLYLTREQYDLRLQKYKVMDCSLEEANSFLRQATSLLLQQNTLLMEQGQEFLSRVLIPNDESFEDTYDLKLRFVAEYFLQHRRAQ